MKCISIYPKVLIIYHSRINKEDQHGVSIRGWFGDWPKENLAQIYSGGESGKEVFCGYNFKIGLKERRLGKYFSKLKSSSLGQSSYPIKPQKGFKKLNKINSWNLFKNKFSKLLINIGLWEIIFKPNLSEDIIKFIKDFEPQLIYCQGYNLTFTWLPVMVHDRFHIPICFQTGDDWPSYLYCNSLLAFIIRPRVSKAVKLLLSKSAVRLANGILMKEIYTRRYGMYFDHIMMCDNLKRFTSSKPKRIVTKDAFSLVYSGGLGHQRWVSIVDLSKAANILQAEGFNIIITAFASEIPYEAINILESLGNLQIISSPPHIELPSYLKGADVLFLPETFDPIELSLIHLSISSKAHLYMMSEKPILVYASHTTGIMDYAEKEGWACKVKERNINKLACSLYNLLTNSEYCDELIAKGVKVALNNHDENYVRRKFLSILNSII